MPNNRRKRRLDAFWKVLRSLEDREVINFKELKQAINNHLIRYDKLTVGELSRFLSKQNVVRTFTRRDGKIGQEFIFLHSHRKHGKI